MTSQKLHKSTQIILVYWNMVLIFNFFVRIFCIKEMKCGQHNHKFGGIFRIREAERDDREIFKVLGKEGEIAFSALWNLQGTILYHPASILLIISPETEDHSPGVTTSAPVQTHTSPSENTLPLSLFPLGSTNYS